MTQEGERKMVPRKASLEVSMPSQRLTGLRLRLCQFQALVLKEIGLRRRSPKLNILLFVSSFLCVAMIWAFQVTIQVYQHLDPKLSSMSTAHVHRVGAIPDCSESLFILKDVPCYSLIYAPDRPEISDIIMSVARQNEPPIPESKLRGFGSGEEIDQYLHANPNTAIAAVEILKETDTKYAFSIATNTTARWFKGRFQDPNLYAQIPVQVAIERALAQRVTGKDFEWTIDIAEFPHPAVQTALTKAYFAPAFYVASMILLLILQVHEIIEEREKGSYEMMVVFGLRNSSYWASLAFWYSVLSAFNTFILSLISLAFGFKTFVGMNFLYATLLLLGVSEAIVGMAFLISSLLPKASHAAPAGIFVFFLAWSFLIAISFGFPYNSEGKLGWKILFDCLPWSILAQGYTKLLDCSVDSTTMQQACSGFGMLYGILALQAVIFSCSAILLNFLMHGRNFPLKRIVGIIQTNSSGHQCDDAVREEEKLLKQRYVDPLFLRRPKSDTEYAVEIHGMKKGYRSKGPFRPKEESVLEESWLGIRTGECFCLLGPNGAGKTTMIKSLLGCIPRVQGNVMIQGNAINTLRSLQHARDHIGFCPQSNEFLFDNLSFEENYALFGALRGFENAPFPDNMGAERHQIVNRSAMGQRRKLSIIMALIGDPKILILDEPTTCLDPKTRRNLWEVIKASQHERSIFLATHSMEEAEMLADRIAIMVRGQLRCMGTSLELKRRFGSGYKISVCFEPGEHNRKHHLVELVQKSIKPRQIDISCDHIHWNVPHEVEDRLPFLLTHLKNNAPIFGIRDIQLRPTLLEEVFMTITKKAELEKAQHEGRYETLILAEEQVGLRIPIGAEYVKSPGGRFYNVKWSKDHLGKLRIEDYHPDNPTEMNLN